ncbi:hypothetical protein DL762_009100 [Monosporascus cannonballus]|uniref:FAD-binding PCMH-type domain-containing protein n=1 Tax=Monosporascus cannonballus TaxID=155416 RepID=A0ABY0GYG6_9PEZI|nr:hypothetical protein DL762_009100 [Monosporascus cannonballus]
MGQTPSSPLADCLHAVCNGRDNCVAFPGTPLYQISWVDRYNLDIEVEPIAVTRPETAEDVSGFVKCAAANNVKVQAKSGGHSYANYGLGGEDGELVVDLRNFQGFSIDTNTWQATFGAGHKLDDVTKKLHKNGKRAISHGTCPGGGLGPESRMWGSCLDHVIGVEVVTADGSIVNASETENSDLFFALKGAGAGFGIITSFVMKTRPEPGSVVQYSYSVTFAKHADLGPVFRQWQELVMDPDLDRRFGTEFTMHELGVIISGTFYGTDEEFQATGIPDRIPKGKISVVFDDWMAVIAKHAEEAALSLSNIRSAFTARSLAFRREDMISPETITNLMNYIDGADRGTLLWFLIFDATGGAISDVSMNATAYSHRDKVMFCQGYGVGIPTLNQRTKDFVGGIINTIQNGAANTLTTYPGYVDPSLMNPQESYWGPNIDTLRTIKGIRKATQYGYSCMQYGSNFDLSEDCLTVNVVRPAGVSADADLPVLVWIYGGGLYAGSTADPQYNLSGIVKVSQDLGRPVVAVSMNYRLGMYGFLQNAALLAEGSSSNAGLLDQRLALHWIQENIAAFGGDPRRVVLWGESAGAQSIAYHMFAYDGRDDGLFRAAILESGGPTGAQVEPLSWYNTAFENLTRTVGCWNGVKPGDRIACLRGVDEATLFAAHPSVVWNPLLDGNFLTGYPSQLMHQGKFVKVPLLTGDNTDEGFAVSVSGMPLDTEEDLFNNLLSWRSYALTPPTARRLLTLYPDDPCRAPPYAITNCTRHPTRGRQWRRAAAIGGDLVMASGRRRMAELYAGAGMPVYSYRFDQRPWNAPEWDGVKHFANVAFSFQNISGLLGPSPEYDGHARLARAIGRAYINFVNDLDPNGFSEDEPEGQGGPRGMLLPEWPVYDLRTPKNMVFNATQVRVEDDTWRKEGIEFMMSPTVAKELLS